MILLFRNQTLLSDIWFWPLLGSIQNKVELSYFPISLYLTFPFYLICFASSLYEPLPFLRSKCFISISPWPLWMLQVNWVVLVHSLRFTCNWPYIKEVWLFSWKTSFVTELLSAGLPSMVQLKVALALAFMKGTMQVRAALLFVKSSSKEGNCILITSILLGDVTIPSKAMLHELIWWVLSCSYLTSLPKGDILEWLFQIQLLLLLISLGNLNKINLTSGCYGRKRKRNNNFVLF